jgi:hypothetical protein
LKLPSPARASPTPKLKKAPTIKDFKARVLAVFRNFEDDGFVFFMGKFLIF